MVVVCCLNLLRAAFVALILGLSGVCPEALHRTSYEAENSRQARHQSVSHLTNSSDKGTEELPVA